MVNWDVKCTTTFQSWIDLRLKKYLWSAVIMHEGPCAQVFQAWKQWASEVMDSSSEQQFLLLLFNKYWVFCGVANDCEAVIIISLEQIFSWIVRVCEDRKGLQGESLIIAEVDQTKKMICDIIPAARIMGDVYVGVTFMSLGSKKCIHSIEVLSSGGWQELCAFVQGEHFP